MKRAAHLARLDSTDGPVPLRPQTPLKNNTKGRTVVDFAHFTDLASRNIGGSVVITNDEFFVEKENLIKPEAPVSCKGQSGNRGGIYDGWETRRRRTAGHDWVVIRLGVPGVVHGVVVDTAFFRGNYPDRISVQACALDGYPAPEDLADAEWVDIVPETPCEGDSENAYPVHDRTRFTHVRLCIHPDGGVARLRVHGEAVRDPLDFSGLSWDLAALDNGGRVIEQSDGFFNPASNVITPGTARTTKDGWETKRRRDDGHDWLTVCLAAPGHIHQAIVDTSRYIGNAPDSCALLACDASTDDLNDPTAWWTLVARQRLQPDQVHRFHTETQKQATHVRLNIFPDGGLSRLRLLGYCSDSGALERGIRWINMLPEAQLRTLLSQLDISAPQVEKFVGARPFTTLSDAEALLDQTTTAALRARLGITHVDSDARG
ncbi:allantoicase [Saccharopolyspora kobensis]|uniref:allantoicase n=1 Tax=Saccharopolyspora kobensis TaxID=146035 RepID=UPI002E26CDB4|nr:allantoicase [Saccharopolyspora kobensis]